MLAGEQSVLEPALSLRALISADALLPIDDVL